MNIIISQVFWHFLPSLSTHFSAPLYMENSVINVPKTKYHKMYGT